MTKVTGEKFTAKYGVETATIYKATADTESMQIPPQGHVLHDPTAPTKFDPIRVEVIDSDGKMTTPIEVWTAPDEGVLWVLDGRGRFLDVQEVNRRRAKDGREPVKPYIVPFNGDEKAAVARVRTKNYHRRLPTPSGMAMDLLALRKAGWSWADCAKMLHCEVEDAEQWGRRLMPLAYCIPEVRAAIDAGELGRGSAHRFGGGVLDGSKALGRKAQLELLDKLLASKGDKPKKSHRPISSKSRERVCEALSNGASENFKGLNREVAKVVAATLARVGGDPRALKAWPEVAAVVEEALKPKPAGRPKKEKEGEE